MLDVGIIELAKELEWISTIVVQDKKTSVIRFHFDLRMFNDASIHDPFPTSFTNEVL